MYYETRAGESELQLLYHAAQAKLTEENEESDDEEEEPKSKKQRKSRRNEVSLLEQENETNRLSNTRPKRAATNRVNEANSGQRKIDEFISKKNSPKKNVKHSKNDFILPPLSINDSEHCPICDRLISNDILEVHTNACITQNSDDAKALLEKSKQRAKTEAKVKEVLFQRTTRHNVATQLIKSNSDTTTCPTCGMQMTVSRLENQHKNECSNRFN